MSTHLEESLQRDIELIRNKVIEMGGLVERALKASLQALVEGNRQVAYTVILRDQHIDELENELDRLCLEFLIRQQPVGWHLRFVYAAIKINNELERVGDYAESIARQFLVISSLDPKLFNGKFVEIAHLAIPMLHDAVQSFVDQNAELARETMELDQKVNQIRENIQSDLLQKRQENKLPLEALAPLMIIASRFERVADQATNMCEEVLYMCTGEYIRHKGTEALRILFVDEHNSCRSQMAEGIGWSLKLPRFVFASAGVEPKPVDPRTVRFLAEKGIDISRSTSKSIEQVPNLDHYQVVASLCKEADEVCPPPPTKTIGLRWQVADPSRLGGTYEEVRSAYEQTFEYLNTHIHDLVQAILGDETETRRKY
jgi:phosphate transport system protein